MNLIKVSEQTLPVKVNKAELQTQLKKTILSLDKKIVKLSGGTTVVKFETSGQFKMNELDGNTVNIHNTPDLVYLLKALGLIRRVIREYNETADSIGLTSYPVCTWFGYPASAWEHDLELRCKIVGNAAVIVKLQQTKTRLSSFLSEEEKLGESLKQAAELLKL